MPVHLVDLEETNVKAAIGIVVHGIGIAAALLADDALAARLRPPVSIARAVNVRATAFSTARARRATTTRTVPTAISKRYCHVGGVLDVLHRGLFGAGNNVADT